MIKRDRTDSDAAEANTMQDDAGDVETAGETTAADMISGPTDTRPVGADTMVKVADTPDPAQTQND
jgi:hypothetical protein